ncbi:MAG: DUF4399 domain-containing protein [Actinomycetota bacterium]
MTTLIPAPLLAHVLNGGGPLNVLLLLLGGSLAILGARVRARVMGPRALGGVATAVGIGLFVLGLVLDTGPPRSSSQARVRIVEPRAGEEVTAQQPVGVSVELEGGQLAVSPSDTTGGHLHLYVDGMLRQMLPSSTETQVTLDPGRHTLTVEYVDSRHVSFDPEVTTTTHVRAG